MPLNEGRFYVHRIYETYSYLILSYLLALLKKSPLLIPENSPTLVGVESYSTVNIRFDEREKKFPNQYECEGI